MHPVSNICQNQEIHYFIRAFCSFSLACLPLKNQIEFSQKLHTYLFKKNNNNKKKTPPYCLQWRHLSARRDNYSVHARTHIQKADTSHYY